VSLLHPGYETAEGTTNQSLLRSATPQFIVCAGSLTVGGANSGLTVLTPSIVFNCRSAELGQNGPSR
jgi:hypothetical protein